MPDNVRRSVLSVHNFNDLSISFVEVDLRMFTQGVFRLSSLLQEPGKVLDPQTASQMGTHLASLIQTEDFKIPPLPIVDYICYELKKKS